MISSQLNMQYAKALNMQKPNPCFSNLECWQLGIKRAQMQLARALKIPD